MNQDKAAKENPCPLCRKEMIETLDASMVSKLSCSCGFFMVTYFIPDPVAQKTQAAGTERDE